MLCPASNAWARLSALSPTPSSVPGTCGTICRTRLSGIGIASWIYASARSDLFEPRAILVHGLSSYIRPGKSCGRFRAAIAKGLVRVEVVSENLNDLFAERGDVPRRNKQFGQTVPENIARPRRGEGDRRDSSRELL